MPAIAPPSAPAPPIPRAPGNNIVPFRRPPPPGKIATGLPPSTVSYVDPWLACAAFGVCGTPPGPAPGPEPGPGEEELPEPFRGGKGKCPTIYNYSYTNRQWTEDGRKFDIGNQGVGQAYGPVSYGTIGRFTGLIGYGVPEVILSRIPIIITGTEFTNGVGMETVITSLSRADGLPDNCGAPTAPPPRPARKPPPPSLRFPAPSPAPRPFPPPPAPRPFAPPAPIPDPPPPPLPKRWPFPPPAPVPFPPPDPPPELEPAPVPAPIPDPPPAPIPDPPPPPAPAPDPPPAPRPFPPPAPRPFPPPAPRPFPPPATRPFPPPAPAPKPPPVPAPVPPPVPAPKPPPVPAPVPPPVPAPKPPPVPEPDSPMPSPPPSPTAPSPPAPSPDLPGGIQIRLPEPPPSIYPPTSPRRQRQRRCSCTPQIEEDEDVVVIRWLKISVPVGSCRQVGPRHVFSTTYKTITVIATESGNEAAKVRGLYQQMHDNLREGCNAANRTPDLGTLLQGVDLGLLAIINNKLGPLVPGGLSGAITSFRGKFDRFVRWIHLDRILNLLNLWATVHNGFMLSRNLGETMFSLLDNVFAGLNIHLKDEEGEQIDVGEWVGDQIDSTFKMIFGVENWTTAKANWNRWNRIYQAAANVMWTVRSLGDTVLGALEIVGSYIAKIGNGLRRAGEVAENAFGWMNPTPRFSNKWMNRYEQTEQVVSDLDSVVSEVRETAEVAREINESRARLTQAISQAPDGEQSPPTPEASQVAAVESEGKTNSQPPEIQQGDL